ncbi:MAG: hypothetical protein ISS36_04745 [Candidatus Aenigmarchaeota archaeon]|nr:hypothetical protein [Candidatus Aenigmarchaeota archaeon]
MKKDPMKIIEQMFKMLESGRPFTINQLSEETGLHNITVKKYVRIIQTIRKEPEIEVIRTKHSIILRIRR